MDSYPSSQSSTSTSSSFPSRQSCRLFTCFIFGAATQFSLFFISFRDKSGILDTGVVDWPITGIQSFDILDGPSIQQASDLWSSGGDSDGPLSSGASSPYSMGSVVSPSFVKPTNDQNWPVRSLSRENRYKLNVVIISNNRIEALRRLCNSLLASHVHERLDMSLTFNLEASSSTELVNYAESFEWDRGHKTVRKRILQGGLIRAVTEAWYPSTSDEYGLFLEDDIEVSPFFTDWIVYAMDMYHAHEFLDQRLVGISLYTPRITETYMVNGTKPPFDGNLLSMEHFGDSQVPLLMQTPCSWGAIYFPRHWRDFLSYLQTRISTPSAQFLIDESRTNGWKASWKRFLFEYLWAKGCYLLYPNFDGQLSFSTNHMEGGIHIGTAENVESGNKREDFAVPLFGEQDRPRWEKFQQFPMRRLSDLPVLDLFNRIFNTEEKLRDELGDIGKYWTLMPPPAKSMSPAARVYDTLSEGQTLWSTPVFKSQLRKQTGYKKDDNIFNGIIRKDGDFVIYGRKVEDENEGDYFGQRVFDTAVDAFDTSKTSTSNYYNHSMTLRNDGMLVLYAHPLKGPPCNEVRCDTLHDEVYCLPGRSATLCEGFGAERVCTNLHNRCKGEKKTKFLVWASPRGEPKPRKGYVAEIDQNGALVVHWGPKPCTIAAKETLYRSSSHGKRPCSLFPSNRELRCKNKHSVRIQGKLSDTSSITIFISTYDRFDILQKQISYYARSPLVSRILVTWHNMHLKPPKSTRIGHVIVNFLPQKEDSLSNRFNPSWQASTDAILIIDDDMKVHLQDIELLFEVWKKNKLSIVGFAPRWIEKDKDGSLVYLYSSEDPPLKAKKGVSPKEGYAIMLTKIMMIHRDFLHYYSCGSNEVRRSVHRMVDLYRNCEDIGINALANLMTRAKKESGAALFVKPLHTLGDFGKSGTALHARSKHQQVRSQCLNLFQEAFSGSIKKGNSAVSEIFPLQTEVIESRILYTENPNTVELHSVSYSGHRTRLHVDCTAENGTGPLHAFGAQGEIYPLPDACKWTLPANPMKRTSFVWKR